MIIDSTKPKAPFTVIPIRRNGNSKSQTNRIRHKCQKRKWPGQYKQQAPENEGKHGERPNRRIRAAPEKVPALIESLPSMKKTFIALTLATAAVAAVIHPEHSLEAQR